MCWGGIQSKTHWELCGVPAVNGWWRKLERFIEGVEWEGDCFRGNKLWKIAAKWFFNLA